MKTYIKRDVIEKVKEKTGDDSDQVAIIVSHMFNTLREMLTGNDLEMRIEIREFGVFAVKKTKPKPKARNPKTKETIQIPARRKTHFKPGKYIKKVLSRPI